MNKKLSGAGAAIVGALLYGGAQLLDIEERLAALEAKQEESAEKPAPEASEDVDEAEPEEEPAEEPEAAPEAEKAEEE
jgi:type II secretory pathway component PulL